MLCGIAIDRWLLLQAVHEPYVVGTDVKLLKWKYGSMNSVDFLLRSKAAGDSQLPHVSAAPNGVHCARVQGFHQCQIARAMPVHAGPELYLGQGSDVILLPGEHMNCLLQVRLSAASTAVKKHSTASVEPLDSISLPMSPATIVIVHLLCLKVQRLSSMRMRMSGSMRTASWSALGTGKRVSGAFMRVRTDKQRPNARHVYEKVLSSIEDNIEEDDIIAEVAEAMRSPVYQNDRPPG